MSSIKHKDFYVALNNNNKILPQLITRLAQTIEKLNKIKLVHSDIKPENICIKLNDEKT